MIGIGNRDWRVVARSCFQRRHYTAFYNSWKNYERPIDSIRRYLFGAGDYPAQVRLRTPTGVVSPTIYSHDDMLTINEIFCRLDYAVRGDEEVIVDFGSNIGLSGLYFLSHCPRGYCYLFEPVPSNVERLERNLRGYEGRYSLSACAVGVLDGVVEFGVEPTGRYGGVGIAAAETIRVACRDATRVLTEVLDVHGRIDVLKVDIEALEKEILLRLPVPVLRKIRQIFVEQSFDRNPFPDLFAYEQRGSVARFRLREEIGGARPGAAVVPDGGSPQGVGA